MAEYYKQKRYKGEDWFNTRKLRRSRNGVLLGVCQGFANWLEIPAWAIRLGVIIAFISSGFFPIGLLYLGATLLMKPELS